MGDIIIRKASIDDAPGIIHVHVQSSVETYTGLFNIGYMREVPTEKHMNKWQKNLSIADEATFIAEDDGKVVGFISVGPSHPEKEIGKIYAMYILASHTGQGIGKKLWQAGVKFLENLGFNTFETYVLRENAQAISFYTNRKGVRENTADYTTPIGENIPQYRYTFHKESLDAGN